MSSLRVPLVLSKYQGQGQLQHGALQGLVVLKAEIRLATSPTRYVEMSFALLQV